jgi:hypothetical protein
VRPEQFAHGKLDKMNADLAKKGSRVIEVKHIGEPVSVLQWADDLLVDLVSTRSACTKNGNTARKSSISPQRLYCGSESISISPSFPT